MDRKDVLATLTRAHDDIALVVEAMANGTEQRLSWTRLLAHNVNNHLTSIFFIIERFIRSDDLTPETQSAYVDGLKDVAERIEETIRRLMTVSQLDSLVRLSPVDVRDVVRESVERQRGYAALKSIRLEERDHDSAPVMVEADRMGLVESVLNLVGNAIKYSPPGKQVDVGVARLGADVEIRVQDEGPGIGPDEQENLFKVGGVLSTKPTAGEPQTGIGLAMTAALVHAMGGSTWCKSLPGKGATFGIRLPLARTGAPGGQTAPRRARSGHERKPSAESDA